MKKGNLSIILCSLLLCNSILLSKDNKTKQLDSVTIIEDTSSNYLTIENPSIIRNNIDLEDMPKSVQVFNSDLIGDLQAQNINTIVEMSSNTVFLGDNHGRENIFAIRGFSGVPILRDGFNLDDALPYPEVFNLERIEVLKGPDSLQFGESNPGGLINLVKKKPDQKDFHGKLELELTSNTSISPKIDLAGSLNKKGSLRYRLVTVYKSDEGIKDYNFNEEKTFIAPSIAYDINDSNTITFVSEYLDETLASDFGTFVNNKGKLISPIETVTSHPDAKFKKKQKIFGFDLNSTYETWNSSLRYRYVDYKSDIPSTHMPLFYKNNTLYELYATQKTKSKEHALEYTLNKNISNHKITFGLDAKKLKFSGEGYTDFTQYFNYFMGNPSYLYTLNLSNLSYGNLTSLSDHSSTYKYYDDYQKSKKYGAFIGDSIELSDKLILSLGVRHSKIDSETSENNNATLPQFGLVYKITPQTTLYTNYSESFTYQTYSDSKGNLLDPEEGKGFEIGIKQKLLDDTINITAALFKIEKKNVAMDDPNSSISTHYLASGKQESKGFELDILGQLTKNWSIIASYGYTNTEDKASNKGKVLSGIPKHSANIFTNYNLSSLTFPGIYIGAGIKYLGKRYADATNTIELDSNLIYSASAGYKKGNWKVNFSLQNITDEEYIESARSARVTVGTPRTFIATLSYEF